MASAGEINCLANPDFAVICSFLDRYGETLGLPKTGYANLQEWIEDSRRIHPQLVDIHVRLLRRTHKKFLNMQLDRWEKGVVKFCHRYSAVDAWEIERFGYKIAKVSTKLTLLKNLLETQFDYNIKFKEKISEIKADDMRCQPLGRDKNGLAYWYFLDNELNLRIFREDQDDVADETWELVCRSRDDLAKLISNLENGVDTKLEKAEQSDVSDASFKSEPVSDANEDSRDSFYSTKQKVAIGQSPLAIKQEPSESGTSESGLPASESDSNLSEPKIVLKIKQGKCEVDSPSKQLKDKFEREKGQKLKKIKCKLKEEIDENNYLEEHSEKDEGDNVLAEEQEFIKAESEDIDINKGTNSAVGFSESDSSNKMEIESEETNENDGKVDEPEDENEDTVVVSNKDVVRQKDPVDSTIKVLKSDSKRTGAIDSSAHEAEIADKVDVEISENCYEKQDFNSSVNQSDSVVESKKGLEQVKRESHQSRNNKDSLKENEKDLKNKDDCETISTNIPQEKNESKANVNDHLSKPIMQSENVVASDLDCKDPDGRNKRSLQEVTKKKDYLVSVENETFDKDIPQKELPCDKRETDVPTCETASKSEHDSAISQSQMKENSEALPKTHTTEIIVDELKDKKTQLSENETKDYCTEMADPRCTDSNTADFPMKKVEKDKTDVLNERTVKDQSDNSVSGDSSQEIKNNENTQTLTRGLSEKEGPGKASVKASDKYLIESETLSESIIKTKTEEQGDDIEQFDEINKQNSSTGKEDGNLKNTLANKFQETSQGAEVSKEDSKKSVNETKSTEQKEERISAEAGDARSGDDDLSQHVTANKGLQEEDESDNKKQDRSVDFKDTVRSNVDITDKKLNSPEQSGNQDNMSKMKQTETSFKDETSVASSESDSEIHGNIPSESDVDDTGQKKPEHEIDLSYQNKKDKSTCDKTLTENKGSHSTLVRDEISKPEKVSDGDKTLETDSEMPKDEISGKVHAEEDTKDVDDKLQLKDSTDRNSVDKEMKNVQEDKLREKKQKSEDSTLTKSLTSNNVESTDLVCKEKEKVLTEDALSSSCKEKDSDRSNEHSGKITSNEIETSALGEVSSEKPSAENVAEKIESLQSITKNDISKTKVNRKRKKDEISKTPNESSTDEEKVDSFSPEIKARKIKAAVRKSTDSKYKNEMAEVDQSICESNKMKDSVSSMGTDDEGEDGHKEEMEGVEKKAKDEKKVDEAEKLEDTDSGAKEDEKKEHQKQEKTGDDDFNEEPEKVPKKLPKEETEDDESDLKWNSEEKESNPDNNSRTEEKFKDRGEDSKSKKPKKFENDDTTESQDSKVSEENTCESKLSKEDSDMKVESAEGKKQEPDLENEESVHQNGEAEKGSDTEEMTLPKDSTQSKTKKTKAQKRQADESTEEIPAEPASKRSKLRGRVSSKGRGGQRAKQGPQSEESSSSDNEDVPLSEIAENQKGGAKKGAAKKRRRTWVGSRRKKSQARKKSTPVKKKEEEEEEYEEEEMESTSKSKEEKDSDKNKTDNKEENNKEIDDEATDIEEYSQEDLQNKLNKSKGNKTTKIVEDTPTFSDEEPGVRRSQRVRNLRARKRRSPSPEFFPSDIEEFFPDEDEFQLDEELDDDDDDDFSLRKKRKAKIVEEELPKGRNALRYEAKTKKKVQKKVVEEEPEDETPCCKCLKSEQPEWILLCDKCDAGYHTACLRPPLMIIPDGDWYCPPCEQTDLIAKLTEHLNNLDQSIVKNDRLQRRKERLAFVSISLDNVLKEDEETGARGPHTQIDKPRGQKARKRKVKEEDIEETEEESESGSGSSSNESDSSGSRSSRNERSHKVQKKCKPVKHRQYSESEEESPPRFVQRKCRSRNPVSYKFEEFEEMIADAIHDDLSIPKEPKPKKVKPLGISRGKDMSNILGVSDEESKPKSRKKRKPRLTELDEDFDDDDTDDYQMSEGSQTSSASASKSVDSEASEESVEKSLRRTRSRRSSQRSARDKRRKSRRNYAKYRGDFVVDSDYDSAEERYNRRPRRKTARYFNYNTETEDEDSFATSELDDSDFERKRRKGLHKKDKKHKKSKKRSGKRQRIKKVSSSENSDGEDEESRPSMKKKGRKNRSSSEESGSETEEETPKQEQKKTSKTGKRRDNSEESESGSDTEVSDDKSISVVKKKNRIQSDSDEEHLNEKGAKEEEEEEKHEEEEVGEDPDTDSCHDDEDGWEEIGAESTDEVSSPKKTPVHSEKNTLKKLTVTLKKLDDKSNSAIDLTSSAASVGKDTTPEVTPTKKKGKQAKKVKGSEDINGKAGETTTPKKRGRKPKQPVEDASQDTQGEETPIKKKRGKKAAEPLEAPAIASAEQRPDADKETEQPAVEDTEDKTESDRVDSEKGSSSDRKDDSPLQSRNKQNAPVGVVKPEVRQGVIVENKQVMDNRMNENRGTENVVNPLQGMREMTMRNQGDQNQEYGGFGPYPGAGGGPYQNRGMEGGFMGPQGFQNYHQGHGQYGQGMSGPVQNHPYGGMSQGHQQGHPQGHPQNMSQQQGSMNQSGPMNQSFTSPHPQSQYPPNSQAQGPLSPNRYQHGNQYMPPNMQQGPAGYYHGTYGPQGVPEGPQNYSFGPQGPQQGPHHGPQNPTFPQGNYPPGHYHPGYHSQHGPYQSQMQSPPYGQQASHPQMGPQGQMQPPQHLPYQNMPYNYPHAPQARHPPGYGPQSSHMQGMNPNQPHRPEPQVSGPQYHQLQSPNMGGHRMHSPAPMNSPVQSMGSPHASMGSPSPSMNSPGVVKPSAHVPSQKATVSSSDVDSKSKTAPPAEEQQYRTNMSAMQEQSQKTMEPAQRKGFMMANILKPKSEKSDDKSSTGEPD